MLLKYITATVTHNSKNYEFSTSKLITTNQESINISDQEVKNDFLENGYLIRLLLNNMIQAKLYVNFSSAELCLKTGAISAEINIIYISDINKCQQIIHNPMTIKNAGEYNDKVSAIRCSYVFRESEIHKYMIYGNPSCNNEFKDPNTIEFKINKLIEVR